jgi:pimeloyl-ACP methyl ester carboxylesterase
VTLARRQVGAAGVSLHALEAGRGRSPSVVLLHGWPQDASAFAEVAEDLGRDAHVVAFDLPEIGGSRGSPVSGEKTVLAGHVRAAIAELALHDVTLAGTDVGGMIAYAYLRAFPGELARAAIMNVAIPGVAPWDEVVRNPKIFHFAFHAVPELPERLVSGRERSYFDWFFDAIAGPKGVSPGARAAHAEAYARPEALKAGFDWYRAFEADAAFNKSVAGQRVETPVLVLRGDRDLGGIDAYVEGLREAGLTEVRGETLTDCGHFAPTEQPHAVAAALRRFLGL